MALRSLDQIVAELGNVYNPLAGQIEQRRAAIPGQIQEQEKGLEARQTQAFDNILGQARQRGLGFSGIPIGEQAKYSATEYMPALANLRRTGQEQEMGLTEALLNLNKERRSQAQGIYDSDVARDLQERQFAEQQRQFNENLRLQREQQAAAARSASAFSPTTGGRNNPRSATATQRSDKGWNFTDQNGNAISAAAYAAAKGIPFRQVLQTMANAGDPGAKAALGFVGDDFGYDPRKLGGNAGVYNSLVWGTGRQASAPRPSNVNVVQPNFGSLRLA